MGIECVDIGGHANFPHIEDNSSQFSTIVFTGSKKKEENTDEIIRDTMLANWIGIFWKTAIIITDNDGVYWKRVPRFLYGSEYNIADGYSWTVSKSGRD